MSNEIQIISTHSDRFGVYFLVRESDGTEQIYRKEELEGRSQ